MSNTKQQIEEVLDETLLIWKQDYPKPDGNHGLLMDEYFDRLEKSKHNLLEAINRLVTEARIEELEKTTPHTDGMRHYNTVKKRIAELQSQLTNKEEK